MYIFMYYVFIYVFMYLCKYVCMYVAPVLQYYYKYAWFCSQIFCNFITKLHVVTNWASTDSYCSCCSLLTCYNNVNWSDSVLTACWQLSVPFCTAIKGNHKAAQYATSRQLKCTCMAGRQSNQQFSSVNSVWSVSVRWAGTASSSVRNCAFSATSRTVVVCQQLYCRSEVFNL
jgi:hypothetical protein